MTLRDRCLEALELDNVLAGLRAIRQGESSQDDAAYRRRWPGTGKPPAYFDSFKTHPRIFEPGPNGRSSAAGAYQITATTYDDFAPRVGVTSFYPPDQDLLAVAIIESCNGALDDLIAGRFADFVAKCGGRWASLPSSTSGQPTRKYNELVQVYENYGGGFAPRAVVDDLADRPDPAPIEERGRDAELTGDKAMAEETTTSSFGWGDLLSVAGPIAAVFNPIAGLVVSAFTPLLQEKIGKEIGRHTDSATAKTVAANLTDVITKVAIGETKKSDPVEAMLALRSDPAMLAKAEAAVTNRLTELNPFIEKMLAVEAQERADLITAQDAAEARSRGAAWDMTPWLVGSAIGMVLLVLIFFGAVAIIDMIKSGKVATEVWAALTGISGTLLGIMGTIFAFRFSSTQQSATKNAVIGSIATSLARK